MPFKQFVNNTALTAEDVNDYLMEQTVIVFADVTERSNALPNPTEGMVTYLKDTDSLDLYTGAAWVSITDRLRTSGGTLTGNLTIQKATPQLLLNNTSTSGTSYSELRVTDSADAMKVRLLMYNDGTIRLYAGGSSSDSHRMYINPDDSLVRYRTGSSTAHPMAFAQAAGSTTLTFNAAAGASKAITFPTGRFTQPPIVTCSVNIKTGQSAGYIIARAQDITTTGATIFGLSANGNVSISNDVGWIAVQMTPTSADG